jgi:hypothetical protein
MSLSKFTRFLRKTLTFTGAIFVLSGSVATPSTANTLVNGGFETGDFTGWVTNFTPPNNAALIITDAMFGPRVHDGTYVVDFSANETADRAILSQTFATNAGWEYSVQYWLGAVALTGTTPNMVTQVLGANGSTVLHSVNSVLLGNGSIQYALIQFLFTADGSTSTLRFTDISPNTNGNDLLLDTVSVETMETPVPAALPLLASGLGLIGWLGRRRKHNLST